MRGTLTEIFYAAMLVIALGVEIALQCDWTPPLIPMWDGRARLYSHILCLLVAIFSALGLSFFAPTNKLPKWLAQTPLYVAIMAPGFVFVSPDLSPASTPLDVAKGVALALFLGVGAGLIVGLLAGALPREIEPEADNIPPARRHVLGVRIICAILVVGLVLLWWPRERDDPKMVVYETFAAERGSMSLGIMAGPLDEKFGVLKVRTGDCSNLLVLDRSDMGELVRLMRKAERAQSDAWRTIGDMSDGGTPATRVRIDAGRGIRLGLTTASWTPTAYNLSPADFARFDATAARITTDIRD